MIAPKRRRPDCAADDLSVYAFAQTLANQFGPADVISQTPPVAAPDRG